jgi:hypothetical protein
LLRGKLRLLSELLLLRRHLSKLLLWRRYTRSESLLLLLLRWDTGSKALLLLAWRRRLSNLLLRLPGGYLRCKLWLLAELLLL